VVVAVQGVDLRFYFCSLPGVGGGGGGREGGGGGGGGGRCAWRGQGM